MPFAALSLLVIGCTSAPPQPTAEKWVELTADGFTIEAPKGWTYVKQQGIDSLCGAFFGDGMTLEYDLGMYSPSLSKYEGSRAAEDEIIDGRQARVVMDRAEGFAGVYIPEATKGRRGEVNLTVYSEHQLTLTQMYLALKIFRTIKFKK